MESQRLILVIALGFTLLLMWQAWMQDYGPQPVAQTSTAEKQAAAPADIPTASVAEAVPAPAPADAPLAAVAEPAAGRSLRVVTDVLDLRVDTRGGVVTQADLLDYPVSLERKDEPFRLLANEPGHVFLAQSGLRASQGSAPDHHAVYRAEAEEYRLQDGAEELRVPLVWEEGGVRVTKTLVFKRGSHAVEVLHEIRNQGDETWRGSQYRQLTQNERGRESALIYTYTGGVYAGDVVGSDERVTYEKIDFGDMAKQNLSADLSNGWVAMIQHYFLAAWAPQPEQVNHFYSLQSQRDGLPVYSLGMVSTAQSIAPGEAGQFQSTLYVGPKIQEDLEGLAEGLELAVDYGIFTILAKPIFWLLDLVHDWVKNWGWAIILVTVLIKLVFYRLSATSYRSMANMRRVAPKLQELKERFGEDRQRMSQEMMKLYKQEKINPLGGCLPILVQIPVFIALYWVLLESVELRQAPWILWIEDLSQKDPYFVLPILMGISMWAQQKLNPPPMDPMQQKIFLFMPWLFTVFFAFFPSGLVLYWLVNNILSIAQQWYITRQIEKTA